MSKIGMVCVKIAGRDAGNVCAIVDNIDKNFVVVEGKVRRKKCNLKHLEPTGKIINIKKGAVRTEVILALKKEGYDLKEDKKATKTKKIVEKPKKQRKIKEKATAKKSKK